MREKSKAKKQKKITVIRDFVSVKHQYSQSEREEITRKLTSAVQHGQEQTEQLKAVSADFKAKIKTATSIVNEATNQLTNGYEMQQVEAEVHLDRKKGIKTLLHYAPGKPEHKKKIRVEKMTEQDYQRLPIDDLPPENPKVGKVKASKTETQTVAEAPAPENVPAV